MKASEPLRYEYIMEKDGKRHAFEKYPTDPDYTYVDSKLLNPDAQAKITDLNIWNDDGEHTDEFSEGTKLVIIIQNVEKVSLNKITRLRQLTLQNDNFDTWILTSSGTDVFEPFRHKYQLGAPYFFVDATVLKTIIRSNPGVLLIKDGIILTKWHHNDTPLLEEVEVLL